MRALPKAAKKLSAMANRNSAIVKNVSREIPFYDLLKTGQKLATQVQKGRKAVSAVGKAAVKTRQVASATFQETTSKTPKMSFDKDGNLTLTGTQFIDGWSANTADYGDINYPTDITAYRLWEYKVNPLEPFWPAVAQKAIGFERFRIKQLEFSYHNSLPVANSTGNIAMAYLGDPSAKLPSSYTLMSTLPGSVSGNIAIPLHMNYGITISDKVQAEGYVIRPSVSRAPDGTYLEADIANTLAGSPLSVLIATEGISTQTANPSTVLGRISVDYSIQLIKAKQADSGAYSTTFGVVNFDTRHSTPQIGYSLPTNGPYFAVGTRTMQYRGYGTQKYDFTIDLILEPGSDGFPEQFIVAKSPNGDVIEGTVGDFIVATDLLGRTIIHVDGTIPLRKNCTLNFVGGFSWKGSLNVNMIPSNNSVTTVYLD